MTPMPLRRRAAGYALAEVIAVLILMAVGVTMAARLVHFGFTTSSEADAAAAAYRHADRIVARLREDAAAARVAVEVDEQTVALSLADGSTVRWRHEARGVSRRQIDAAGEPLGVERFEFEPPMRFVREAGGLIVAVGRSPLSPPYRMLIRLPAGVGREGEP